MSYVLYSIFHVILLNYLFLAHMSQLKKTHNINLTIGSVFEKIDLIKIVKMNVSFSDSL